MYECGATYKYDDDDLIIQFRHPITPKTLPTQTTSNSVFWQISLGDESFLIKKNSCTSYFDL